MRAMSISAEDAEDERDPGALLYLTPAYHLLFSIFIFVRKSPGTQLDSPIAIYRLTSYACASRF
jgi:hypothetical protein